MNRLTSNSLESLANHQVDRQTSNSNCGCVSIFAPMYRTGKQVQQNEIRFGNSIKSARNQLEQSGCDNQAIDKLLAPAEAMLADSEFWQHQSEGLAVFLADDGFVEFFQVPCDLEELVVLGDRFHLKPLTRVLADDHYWYILAASPNRIRLLRSSKGGIEDLEPESFPDDLRGALNIDEYVNTLQFHSTSNNSGAGQGDVAFHGQGGNGNEKKDELLQYFHRLDKALCDYLEGQHQPLVFAGVQRLSAMYKEVCNYPNLVDEAIIGNPDETPAQELHKKSIEIIEPIIRQRKSKFIESYREQAHTDWASDDVAQIRKASKMAQIKTLIIDLDKEQWVIFDDEGQPKFVDENSADAEELFNSIAVETLIAGGSVVAVNFDGTVLRSDDDTPFEIESGIAAVFRSPVGTYIDEGVASTGG